MSDLPTPGAPPTRVKCPACSELIIEGARICKFCKEILDPVLREERARASAAPPPRSPAQQAYEKKVSRSLGWSIAGTLILSWAAGLVLGPLLLFRVRGLGKEAQRLGLPRPGELAGILVCGLISVFLGLSVGSAVALPFLMQSLRPAAVTVDNGLPAAVTFTADGQERGRVPPGEHRRFDLKQGEHRLTLASADGSSLYDAAHPLKAGGKYVLNPGAHNSYAVTTNEYTTGPTIRFDYSPPPSVDLKGDAFMDLSEYDYVLEPLPSQIAMGPGETRARRRTVQRTYREPAPVPQAEPPPPQAAPAPDPPAPANAPPVKRELPIERRVRLEVKSESWRDGGPFAIEKELKAKLAAAGVGTLGKGAKAAAGTLRVEYTESKGKEYKSLDGLSTLGNATDFELSVEVLDSEGAELLTLSASGTPPDFINAKDLFEPGLDALKSHPIYQFLEYFVAASLGMKSALPKLVPALTWDEADKVARQLLGEYRPRTPEERAWFALAEGDYDACVGIGEPAVEPIVDLMERQGSAPGSLDEKAAGALAKIGGPKAARAVLAQLRSRKDIAGAEDDVVQLLAAAATLGDSDAIPIAEELARSESEDVSAAAKKALRSLRRTGEGARKLAPPKEESGDAQADGFSARGLDRLKSGKWNAAAAFFTRAIEAQPAHGPYRWNRARSYWNARSWGPAIEDLEKVCELVPTLEDEARLRICVARSREGDPKAARAELQAYLKDRPAIVGEEWFLPAARALAGEISAQRARESLPEGGPKKADLEYYLGAARLLDGDGKGAALCFRRCLEASGGSGWAAESARLELEGLEGKDR